MLPRRGGAVEGERLHSGLPAWTRDSPLSSSAPGLESHWLLSDWWPWVVDGSYGGEEDCVGGYAVRSSGVAEPLLTCFYLLGPSRRHAENLLSAVITRHRVATALCSTTDSLLLSQLLDLPHGLNPGVPMLHVFTYGGAEPAFPLFPQAIKTSSTSTRTVNDYSIRTATSADCVRLGSLIGDAVPSYARLIACGDLFVAASSAGLVVGAVWCTHSVLAAKNAEVGMQTAPIISARSPGLKVIY